MELWDLYDKDRRPLGRTHQRGLPVPPGAYHLAVIVVILNPKGEVLLTRRAPEKDACPGWWENTGGSVLAGETSLEAITRELREETGLAARPEDIRFQAGETDAARWVPLADWEAVAGTEGTLCPARKEEYKQELYRRIALYLQGQREFS